MIALAVEQRIFFRQLPITLHQAFGQLLPLTLGRNGWAWVVWWRGPSSAASRPAVGWQAREDCRGTNPGGSRGDTILALT
jgi:hypothetical protein